MKSMRTITTCQIRIGSQTQTAIGMCIIEFHIDRFSAFLNILSKSM